MNDFLILALDQGTTSSRSLLIDNQGVMVDLAQETFEQIYPEPGWVEHDPMAIWHSQLNTAKQLVNSDRLKNIKAIGITNQRETTLLWHADTGKPLFNALVWQDKRSAYICEDLIQKGWADYIKAETGLMVDAYFSATKIAWVLEHVPEAKAIMAQGKLRFGTVDSWLLWNLTGGKMHATDYSNASRTMLFNIKTGEWDAKLLDLLGISPSILPEVKSSNAYFGETLPALFGEAIPIYGIAGDQQSALFGQLCLNKGEAKVTYGTGAFLLMNSGNQMTPSANGLLTTIAWKLDNQPIVYALEGAVFVVGAVIKWLIEELGLFATPQESESLAYSVPDNGGVYFVPAFVGLGAPHWDMYARGSIFGLTRGTKKAHLVRAGLESIGYQVNDLLQAMQKDANAPLLELKTDGGVSRNNFLLQFQADLLGCDIHRGHAEVTAYGAAYLAGLGAGLWSIDDLKALQTSQQSLFSPQISEKEAQKLTSRWNRAVERAKHWVEAEE